MCSVSFHYVPVSTQLLASQVREGAGEREEGGSEEREEGGVEV